MQNSTLIRLSEKDVARFWSKVDRSGGPNACWPWRGYRNRKGYGVFGIRTGVSTLAHRVAWHIDTGKQPDEMKVCHRCDNRPCCNPAHLFLGTQLENMRDCVAKGRKERGSKVAIAKLTEGQVILIREMYERYVPLPTIAETFGISQVTVRDVATGKTWKHIPGAISSRRAPFGERSGSAKLLDEQVTEIRNRYATGGVTQQELASEYGVSFQLIHLIVHNKVRRQEDRP